MYFKGQEVIYSKIQTVRSQALIPFQPGWTMPLSDPEHAYLHDIGRVEFTSASDQEALEAFYLTCQTEGIIPALETAHGIAGAVDVAATMSKDEIMIINLSGRGDKDVESIVGGVPE